MLGDQIGTLTGRTTGQRVLRDDSGGMVVEASMEGDGEVLGVPYHQIATYTTAMRADGALVGSGQGVIMSPEGDSAEATFAGIGFFTGEGGISYRGSVQYESASERFAPLTRVFVVFEYELDREGNARGASWEWK